MNGWLLESILGSRLIYRQKAPRQHLKDNLEIHLYFFLNGLKGVPPFAELVLAPKKLADLGFTVLHYHWYSCTFTKVNTI